MKFKYMEKERVLEMYQHLCEQRRSGLTSTDYCREHNINNKAFVNARFRLLYKGGRDQDREENKKVMEHTRYCLDNDISLNQYSQKHSIDIRKMKQFSNHIKYVAVVKETYGENFLEDFYNIVPERSKIKPRISTYGLNQRLEEKFSSLEKGDEAMQEEDKPFFIQRSIGIIDTPIAEPQSTPQPVSIESKPEVLEAKNTIEIAINSGVKVLISSEVSSDKLIKIISFLREL